jgi:hypothetical protein
MLPEEEVPAMLLFPSPVFTRPPNQGLWSVRLAYVRLHAGSGMLYSRQPTLNQGQLYSQDNSFIQSEFFSNRKTYISFLVNRLNLLSLVGRQPLVVSIYSDLNGGLKMRYPGQLYDL